MGNCVCDNENETYKGYFSLDSLLYSPKEDQKARVEAQPVLKQSFEERVLALATLVWVRRPVTVNDYTWPDALSDATDIVLAAEFECSIEEITND